MKLCGFFKAVFCLLATACPVFASEPMCKAGVAVKIITPDQLMWMAGYVDRKHPAEGKLQELYAKALALEDEAGNKLVLLTSDLVGMPRGLSVSVTDEVGRKTGLPRDRLMLTVSHTHCGPVLRSSLNDMYDMPPEEWAKVDSYSARLKTWLVEVIVDALADLKPARLSKGQGTARFALNRRESKRSGNSDVYLPRGPVDHDVPVLAVESPEGKLRAVVFGYACHNTTLQFYQWSGDYAGFAQAYLEAKHPGAKALFWSGCGADANPLPRTTVALCKKYGRELADAVEGVLSGDKTAVNGPFAARYTEITLPFDKLPTRQKLAADLLSKNFAIRRRAARLSKEMDANGKLDDHYRHYPIQVWKLGPNLLWVALGGEVVVEYDLRLKKELAGRQAVWVTAYANDVMAYIPSRRVLKEGGYEGDTSMIYYGQPTKWAPPIEEMIVGKVHELAK
jgi:neutral ceramidase